MANSDRAYLRTREEPLIYLERSGYHLCQSAQCVNKVRSEGSYCCYPCGLADQLKYEPHNHSPRCKSRQREYSSE